MGDQEENLVEFPGILVLILKISKGHNTNLWSFFFFLKTPNKLPDIPGTHFIDLGRMKG